MIYEYISNICATLNIFVRERRVAIKDKIDYCLQIFAGATQGSIVKLLIAKGMGIAKQSVNEWTKGWQTIMEYIQTTPRKARKKIAIDETKIKINGKWAFLWCAIDVESRELLAIEVSWLRNGAVAIWFIKDVLKKCKNKKKVVIITDGAGWYPWACKLLHIKHKEVHGGKRNYVERFNRTFKDWCKSFNKNFVVMKGNELDRVEEKIEAWCVWYNNIRYHNGIRGVPCLT